MQIARSRRRTAVDIAIVVTTVLDSLEGTIVDLSEGGAQIHGCSLPVRSQCQISFEGQIVFGTVQWSEPDRMGIRFPYELIEGPLFRALDLARTPSRSPAPYQPQRSPLRRPSAGAGGFGRRTG